MTTDANCNTVTMNLFLENVSIFHSLLIFFKIFTHFVTVCQPQMIVDEPFVDDELDCPEEGDRTLITGHELTVPWGDPFRAFKTVPKGMMIAPSYIPKAGYGIIADSFIKKYTWLGEYEGEIVPMDREDDISWYAWSVHRGGEDSYFIDARNIATSSSLRWINCARNLNEQNVFVYECRGKIYYMTGRDIAPSQELLVYYGDDYAKMLGIKFHNNQNKK